MASVVGKGKKYVPYIQGAGEISERLFHVGTPTMPIGGRLFNDDIYRNPDDLLRDVEDFFSDFNPDEFMAEISGLLARLKAEGVYGSLPFILATGGTLIGGLLFLGWYANYANKKAKKKWSGNNNGKKKNDGKDGTIIFEPPAIFVRELLTMFDKLPR